MLLDLTSTRISIDQDAHPGEVVLRVISKNPLDEPPLMSATPDPDSSEDGDDLRTTIDGAFFPYEGGEKAPPTTTVHLYRLPLAREQYLVVSWNPATEAYYGFGITVDRVEGAYWACFLNEDDLSISDSGEEYRSLKNEVYDSLDTNLESSASLACLRVKLR